jgi:hypothetical protein
MDDAMRKKADEERLKLEEEERKRKRDKDVRDRIALDEIKRLLVTVGRDPASVDLSTVDKKVLEKEVRELALKARDDEHKKRAETAKKLDYLIRSLREAERAKLPSVLSASIEQDTKHVSDLNARASSEAAQRHQAAMSAKARLIRLLPFAQEFEEKVFLARKAAAAAERVSTLVVWFRLSITLPSSSRLRGVFVTAGPLNAFRGFLPASHHEKRPQWAYSRSTT